MSHQLARVAASVNDSHWGYRAAGLVVVLVLLVLLLVLPCRIGWAGLARSLC